MQILRHAHEVSAYLAADHNSTAQSLIHTRMDELVGDEDTAMEEVVFFVILDAQDDLTGLASALGTPLKTPDGFPLWEKAIEHHWFAVHSTSFPYKEYYSHLKRLRGIQGRKGYCECFMIPKEQYKLVQTLENL